MKRRTGGLIIVAACAILLFQNCTQNFQTLDGHVLASTSNSSTTAPGGTTTSTPTSGGSSSSGGASTSAPPIGGSTTLGAGYDIIVVAGQSNAVGSGMGVFTDDHSQDSLISQLGRFQDDKKIVAATDGLQHWDYPYNQTYGGLGMSFAREYAKTLASNRRVLIVPTAKGGSSILQWAPDQTYYTDMKSRVLYALSLNSQNRVVAFLWHQGESDILTTAARSGGVTSSADYGSRLQTMVQSVRRDFSTSGSFPIVAGGYVPGWNIEGAVDVSATKTDFQNVTRSILSANPPGYYVSSAQLNSNYESGASADIAQNIHFSGASQITLGKRYFQVFQSKQSSPQDVAPVSALAVITNLMLTVMGRSQAEINADPAGISYWVSQYQAGVSEAQIKAQLMMSDEYFVRRAYESELRRKADAAGLAYYLGLLTNKQMTRDQVTADLRSICQAKLRGECTTN